jgi:hypothetical protein
MATIYHAEDGRGTLSLHNKNPAVFRINTPWGIKSSDSVSHQKQIIMSHKNSADYYM